MKFVNENIFYVLVLAPRRSRRELKLRVGNHVVDDKVLKLGLDLAGYLLAHTESNGERLGQLNETLFCQTWKWRSRQMIDHLYDAEQFTTALTTRDRHHHHLFGSVAGTLIDRFQKCQVRRKALEF